MPYRSHLFLREIRCIRRGDERLDALTADEGEERGAAVGVKLAHHVVEQEDRRLADAIVQIEKLREL